MDTERSASGIDQENAEETRARLIEPTGIGEDSPWKIVVGVVVLVALAIIFFYAFYKLYDALIRPSPAPPPSAPTTSLSLSAHFEEITNKAPSLRIAGEVRHAGKPLDEGKVKITIQKLPGGYRQSVLLDVTEGKFDAFDRPVFRSLQPNDSIQITAALIPTDSSSPVIEEIYLSESSLFKYIIYKVSIPITVVFIGVFLWAFTGPTSSPKNRVAIVFSYLIIGIFLALPLISPVIIVYAFPSLLNTMKASPVGIVIAKLDNKKEDSKPQWTLNIGGYIKREDPKQEVVEVQGGLIIPLYVIILSVIGGAINMTRQLPKFQAEGEAMGSRRLAMATAYVGEKVGYVGEKVGSLVGVTPAATPELSLKAKSGESGEASSSAPASSEQKVEDNKDTNWRTGLLNQYMFLISAPFLAMATYYILAWLDLTKDPIVVLVSFSVGLISEPILRRITELASKFIQGEDVNRDSNPKGSDKK